MMPNYLNKSFTQASIGKISFDLFHIPLEPRFNDGRNYINKTSNKDCQNELRNILNKRGFISGKKLVSLEKSSLKDDY